MECLLFVIALCLASSFDYSKSIVTSVTDDTLNQFIPNEKCVILEFYSPSCPHCVSLAPIYEKLYQQVNTERTDVIIAKLDGQQNSRSSNVYNIEGYPTIAAFLPGNKTIFHEKYKGARNVEDIKSWIYQLCPMSLVKSRLSEILADISLLTNTTYTSAAALRHLSQFSNVLGSELVKLVDEYHSMQSTISKLERKIEVDAAIATSRVSWTMIIFLIAIGCILGYLIAYVNSIKVYSKAQI